MSEKENRISLDQFREWIRSLKSSSYELIDSDDKEWLLKTEYATGKIVFHPQDIIELMIVSAKDESIVFYLHFQLNEAEHAKTLVNEMIETLTALKTQQKLKVLLSCTSGLTTSFFASELNSSAQKLSLEYEFSAVSFNHLFDKGFDYDVILLAPQVHYEYEKVRSIFRRKIVLKIPAASFAGYKSGDVIEMIMNALREQKTADPEKEAIRSAFDNDLRIFCICMISHRDSYRIGYCIYDHGKRTLDKEVIKEQHTFKDIEDLIDYVMVRHENINAVAIAYPGIVHHGRVYHPQMGMGNSFNIGAYLEEKYGLPVIMINDVNAMALGYFALHEDSENMVFYFQPRGNYQAGAGIINEGRLLRGWKSSSGEIARMIEAVVEEPEKKILNPEGALEIVSKGLLAFITTVAPKKAVVYSELTPDVQEIRSYIGRYISEEYIPEIIWTDTLKSYMLPGAMIHALDVLKRLERNPEYYSSLEKDYRKQ